MINVTLIRPKGCTHCTLVKGLLENMKKNYPDLTIGEIDVSSPEGQSLIRKHGILSSPGILVNDAFFAMGGATEEQFRAKFDAMEA